jgi:hypothetical protein
LLDLLLWLSLHFVTCTPKNEVLNFKQSGGENLKDAWYRICDAQNRPTRKQSTNVLLRNFYVGVTTWYRFVLDTITGGNFLSSPSNAMGNLVRSPPLTINEKALTLEHVMRRLEVIENKMSIVEHIESLDKKVHNHVTKFGSSVGTTLKMLKEKEPIITERVEQSPARIAKLEEIINNLGSACWVYPLHTNIAGQASLMPSEIQFG